MSSAVRTDIGFSVSSIGLRAVSAGAPLVAGTLSVTSYTDTVVNLSWVDATGGTAPYSYQVQRAADSGGSPGAYSNIGSPQAGTTYSDTGRVASTKYWYRVVVTDNVSATATSNEVSVTTLAGSIAVSTPVPYQTFQRSSGTASIPITGTFTQSPVHIEASFNGGSYATIVASPSAGVYSGTLTGQAAGRGTLTARWTNDTSISATAANIGIGDVYATAGQSNMSGRATNGQTYSGTPKAAKRMLSMAWADLSDPSHNDTSAAGSLIPVFATQIIASQSQPPGFITAAIGGSTIAQWQSGQTNYVNLLGNVTDSGTNAVKSVLFLDGETDAANSVSRATFSAALAAMAVSFNGAIAGAPYTIAGQIGEVTSCTRAQLDAIRLATQDCWGAGNVLEGPCLWDIVNDGLHFKTDASITLVGNRFWACAYAQYYGGTRLNPQITSAVANVARDAIVLTFNQTMKTGLTMATATFRVFDNGGAKTISTVTDGPGSGQITVTLTSACSGPANTITLDLASGHDGYNVVVPQSADITLPNGGSVNLVPRVYSGLAVSEFSSGGPSPWFVSQKMGGGMQSLDGLGGGIRG